MKKKNDAIKSIKKQMLKGGYTFEQILENAGEEMLEELTGLSIEEVKKQLANK